MQVSGSMSNPGERRFPQRTAPSRGSEVPPADMYNVVFLVYCNFPSLIFVSYYIKQQE